MFFFFPFGFLIFFFVLFGLARAGQRWARRFQDEERPPERPLQRLRLLGRGEPEEREEVPRRKAQDPEARVFRLARKCKGRLTVSDAVIDLGLSVREAEELLNGLVDGRRVRVKGTPNGLSVYEFPEILARFQRY